MTEATLGEWKLKVENKDLFVDLKKNRQGTYLKISERAGSSRNTVLIPAGGVLRLKQILEEVVQTLSDTPKPIRSVSKNV